MQSISGVFARIDQQYLFQARQMQALSLAVHIPLVCFGIAFPAMVLFAEWRYLRTGDPLFRTLARRWSKVMLALFAIGVVTGTILSFEFGLLWPGFMAAFSNVPLRLPDDGGDRDTARAARRRLPLRSLPQRAAPGV